MRNFVLTKKLFYENAYIKEFVTQGLKQEKDEQGNWYIVLAQTAFYPTGGGQPYDTGTLNGVEVINVEEIDGEIRHYLESNLADLTEITGVIDWERRFDHMQQHSGQHVLTAAFVELFNIGTVSFHLGKETSTIDIDTSVLSEDMLKTVEERVNEIILENRPIETKWVTKEEALNYELRKELSVTENIRLVIIPDYDYNGCGGTHPTSTGQIQMLKISGWEKQKNHVRVEFVCGNRVLSQLHRKHSIMGELSQLLSSPELDMTTAVKRLLENNKELGKSIEDLREQLLQFEGQELLSTLMEIKDEKIIGKVYQNRTIQQLQKLAKIVTSKNQGINVFFVAENEGLLQFVCARDSKAGINMKTLAKQILPLIDGKGGGNDLLVQGGGKGTVSGDELLKNMIKLADNEMFV